LKWFDAQTGERPEERLADFNTLLSRCQKPILMDDKPLRFSRVQAADISRLHKDFRNNFVHFVPVSWSIEKAGLPRIIRVAIDCIEILMEHPRVQRKLTGNMRRQLSDRLKTTRAYLA
jgi:hypothetical protein